MSIGPIGGGAPQLPPGVDPVEGDPEVGREVKGSGDSPAEIHAGGAGAAAAAGPRGRRSADSVAEAKSSTEAGTPAADAAARAPSAGVAGTESSYGPAKEALGGQVQKRARSRMASRDQFFGDRQRAARKPQEPRSNGAAG